MIHSRSASIDDERPGPLPDPRGGRAKWLTSIAVTKVLTLMAHTDPIIIIGMHRSGTSMLTRLLGTSGVFIGRRLTRNAESTFMNRLNYWVFDQASATWDQPNGVDHLLAHDEVRPYVSQYLAGVTRGPASARYLGLGRWLKYRSMHTLDEPWGWKDPRSTYTLPLWLEIFPGARVLHIKRHGVDVAQSLRARHRLASANAIARYRRRQRLYDNNPVAPKRGGFGHAPAMAELEAGLRLWRAYTERASWHVANLGDRALELRYEDLLNEPDHQLARVLEFCRLAFHEKPLRSAVERIRPGRRFAFAGDPELVAFARTHHDALAALGYSA